MVLDRQEFCAYAVVALPAQRVKRLLGTRVVEGLIPSQVRERFGLFQRRPVCVEPWVGRGSPRDSPQTLVVWSFQLNPSRALRRLMNDTPSFMLGSDAWRYTGNRDPNLVGRGRYDDNCISPASYASSSGVCADEPRAQGEPVLIDRSLLHDQFSWLAASLRVVYEEVRATLRGLFGSSVEHHYGGLSITSSEIALDAHAALHERETIERLHVANMLKRYRVPTNRLGCGRPLHMADQRGRRPGTQVGAVKVRTVPLARCYWKDPEDDPGKQVVRFELSYGKRALDRVLPGPTHCLDDPMARRTVRGILSPWFPGLGELGHLPRRLRCLADLDAAVRRPHVRHPHQAAPEEMEVLLVDAWARLRSRLGGSRALIDPLEVRRIEANEERCVAYAKWLRSQPRASAGEEPPEDGVEQVDFGWDQLSLAPLWFLIFKVLAPDLERRAREMWEAPPQPATPAWVLDFVECMCASRAATAAQTAQILDTLLVRGSVSTDFGISGSRLRELRERGVLRRGRGGLHQLAERFEGIREALLADVVLLAIARRILSTPTADGAPRAVLHHLAARGGLPRAPRQAALAKALRPGLLTDHYRLRRDVRPAVEAMLSLSSTQTPQRNP